MKIGPLTLPGVVHLLTGFQTHSKLLKQTLRTYHCFTIIIHILLTFSFHVI